MNFEKWNESKCLLLQDVDEVEGIYEHLNSCYAEISRLQKIVEASEKFVDRLELVHNDPAYKSVWMVSQMHVGPYAGPSYHGELNELKSALAQLRQGEGK